MYNRISMATKSELKPVGFRLPLKLVEQIDKEAENNFRDRTGEIVHAITEYYKFESEKKEILKLVKEMTDRIVILEKEVEDLKK